VITARARPGRLDRVVFGVVVAISGVILFAPSVPGPPLFSHADLIIHCLLFGALAWTGRRAGLVLPAMAAALVLYAGGSELIQAIFLSHRSGSWTDLAADLTGSALGLAVAARGRAAARSV
jgi:hypothetical protein